MVSTSLASVGYGRESKVLEIEFKSGAVYRYRSVPEEVYRALMAAPSKGRYFSERIRGRYPFQRLAEEKL